MHTFQHCIHCSESLVTPVPESNQTLPLCGDCQGKAILADDASVWRTINAYEETSFGFTQHDDILSERESGVTI